jgi:tripartite-type tricarboxylate transporter receptor subunit TctC
VPAPPATLRSARSRGRPPNGYTLLLASGGYITANRLVYKMPDIDPLKGLVAIAPVAGIKLIFAVNKNVLAKTLREFIALAKARPGKINFTSAGPGSTTHRAGEWLARIAGIELVRLPHSAQIFIPLKAAAKISPALIRP